MINPNAIQKGSITKEMLTQGARRPIILTPETTEVDEKTYQKLLSDDVDVMFKAADGNLCTLTFANFGISDTLNFTCLSMEGNTMADLYIYGYSVAIDKNSPHICHITEDMNNEFASFLNEAGYLNKYQLSPVLQKIDLTGTDAERKAKLDQFEIDWKALTGASDLTGARFVGNYEGELVIMAYSFANAEYEGICYGSTQQMCDRYTLELGGSLTVTHLFSHLEPVEIFTDNSVASKQKNIDNLNAYKSNLAELGVDTNKSFQVPFREGDKATFIGTLQYSVDTNTYIGVGCSSDEDTARIIRISSTGESTITNLARADNLSRVIRDLGMYPELEPVPLNAEVTGKYINSDGKYVDASDWNIASIGAVSLGNTYLLNMVSSANMVLGVALFVSRVYKRDKEGKIIGTTLTPLFSAKNTSIPASGYVLFEAMDDYDEVLVCYKPALTTQMLVARWGFKASYTTQLRNLRLIVDNKTDFEGIYELLTAGYALNLVGKGNGEPQAFLSRKTGGGNITDGSAVIKEVDGVQPIVWNQLAECANTIFDKYSSWDSSSRQIIINYPAGTSEPDDKYSYWTTPVPSVVLGHTYLYIYDIATIDGVIPSGISIGFGCRQNSTKYAFLYGSQVTRGVHTNIIKFNSLRGDDYNSIIGYTIGGRAVTFDSELTLRVNIQWIDLTQMFGAGNEPSTYEEYLDRISHYHIKDAYAYNAGEVVNYKGTGIKTTGRNLWDEEWNLKGIVTGTGRVGSWTNRIASKNYIKCLSGVNYYFKSPVPGWYIFFYDSYYNYISEVRLSSLQSEKEFTTPSNASYMKFSDDSSNYGTTYNHDICINLSDPAFNGQYEPYKSYVRDWSEVMKKYFPDGMTSLNGAKDFFNEKKAVRKFGVVDLGELEWQTNTSPSEANGMMCRFSVKPTGLALKPNFSNCVLSPKFGYAYDAGMNASYNHTCFSYADGRVFFNIALSEVGEYSKDAVRNYMQGVPLYYELSEPVEDIFDKELNLTYTVINGGTETSLATENSTQFEGSIAYNKDYVAVVDELQMQNRVTQIEFENWEN